MSYISALLLVSKVLLVDAQSWVNGTAPRVFDVLDYVDPLIGTAHGGKSTNLSANSNPCL